MDKFKAIGIVKYKSNVLVKIALNMVDALSEMLKK